MKADKSSKTGKWSPASSSYPAGSIKCVGKCTLSLSAKGSVDLLVGTGSATVTVSNIKVATIADSKVAKMRIGARVEIGETKKVIRLTGSNFVVVGANTTIDRATMGSTIIKKGVKLDNLIQIAHNVEIGENTVIAAQSGISGSTKIGKHNMIGGQVGVVGHIQTANGTKVGAQSGITKSITTPNTSVNETPAFDYKASLKSQAIFRNLPDLQKRILELEQQLAALKNQLNP